MNQPETAIQTKKRMNVRKLVMTAMLAAVSTVLMMISFSVPLMPSFIKMDLSELPALLAAFSMGPVSGVAVCLVKNLVNLLFTTTGGVGELCNFLLGACFVLPAGLLYRFRHNRSGALLGAVLGAFIMALASLPINYFITYPAYSLFLSMDQIIGMYQVINPNVSNLFEALLWFNAPFTFIKGILVAAITFVIYKPLSPIIHGRK